VITSAAIPVSLRKYESSGRRTERSAAVGELCADGGIGQSVKDLVEPRVLDERAGVIWVRLWDDRAVGVAATSTSTST
jgi:hypothetical protein